MLGSLAGILLAIGLVLAIDYLDDTIKTPEDITRRLKLPFLGMPEDGGGIRNRLYLSTPTRTNDGRLLGVLMVRLNADTLIAYAKANTYVGWLSFWSLGRDNGSCAGNTTASASCSGITQNNYDFTNKFKAFP